MKAILFAAAATVAFAVPTIAQMQGGPAGQWTSPTTRAEAEAKARARFADTDANKDGFVTTDEIHARVEHHMAEARGRSFDRVDTDHNGTITREEYSAGRDAPDGPRIVVRRVERMSPEGAHGDKPEHREMRVMMMHKGGVDGGGMIMMTDTDKDGRISQAEAISGALKLFDQTDTDHDGSLSMEERTDAMRAWGAKMHDAPLADPPLLPPGGG